MQRAPFREPFSYGACRLGRASHRFETAVLWPIAIYRCDEVYHVDERCDRLTTRRALDMPHVAGGAEPCLGEDTGRGLVIDKGRGDHTPVTERAGK